MTRFRAAGIHLLLSLLIVATVLVLMLGVWYPGAYFKLMGGGGLLFIMAGVDICLGPLLTLIVFKSGKKTLKFDLTVIALVQLAALSYGVMTMFEARPVFTVFTKDQFRVASSVDIDPKELARAKVPEWQNLPLTGPIVVVANPSADRDEKDELMTLAISGIDWHQLPRLYTDYKEQHDVVLKAAKPLIDLRKISEKNIHVMDVFLSKHSRKVEDFVFVPIRTQHAEMAVILDAKTAEIVDIVDAVPWN